MGDASEKFFSELPELTAFEDAVSTHRHTQAPEDWHVVITDVKGSTKAIESGRYKDVNAVGVASIIALRNAIPDLELPYVFGGDGATILLPETRLEPMRTALRGVRDVARDAFGLDLRASHVPIARLKKYGHPLLVGRYRLSPHIVLAALSGRGVSVAEEWVKDPLRGEEFSVSAEGPAEANLEGFECRWQPAPSVRGKMVSLLVVALGDLESREETYRKTLAAIDSLTGDGARHPLSSSSLRLRTLTDDFSTEAKLLSGQAAGKKYRESSRRAKRSALLGRGLLQFKMSAGSFDGTKYVSEFLQNTDFQKFDEALRMVIDLTVEDITRLQRYLRDQFARGKLAYGLHQSSEALITCMVKSYSGDHVHFVDGADGGYALAAKQLKEQLKSRIS